MKTKSEVSTFYDNFNLNRKGTYRNLRHLKLINLLFSEGLKKDSSILEIGCGSGPISEVLAKYVKKGRFTGMDISEESIKMLNFKFADSPNVNFISSDLNDFSVNEKFDFILLADVLEHIPVDIHEDVFEKLNHFSTSKTKIIINIPSFELINWMKVNKPKELQIIDQALLSSHVISLANKNGFSLKRALKHKLFHETEDYELFVFEKDNNALQFKPRSRNMIILEKLKNRIKTFYNINFR